MVFIRTALTPVLILCLTGALVRADGSDLIVDIPINGSVSAGQGLQAWDRIHDVVSHPRCVNCHVDAAAIPLWTIAGSDLTRPHGMNILGGDSRIGAETLPCSTCHVTANAPNVMPHAAPHTGMDWRLAPVEFVWTDRTTAQICAQMRDPDRNGGRDLDGLIEHVTHDAEVGGFITWGFNPGAGREPAPGGLQAHLDDIIAWGVAGFPCPAD